MRAADVLLLAPDASESETREKTEDEKSRRRANNTILCRGYSSS